MDLQEIRDRLVTAMTPHVVFDGWTKTSLRAASEDAEIDALTASHAFPNGMVDVVEHFLDLGDRRMLAELKERNMQDMPQRQRLCLAILVRLEQFGGDREAMRRALSVLALPMNAAVAMRTTLHTVDAIWHGIGDEATSFFYYTKRASLVGIYSATVLFWLGDTSRDSIETKDFLDRRAEDFMRLVKLRDDISRNISYIPTPARFLARLRGPRMSGSRAEFMG